MILDEHTECMNGIKTVSHVCEKSDANLRVPKALLPLECLPTVDDSLHFGQLPWTPDERRGTRFMVWTFIRLVYFDDLEGENHVKLFVGREDEVGKT